MPFKNKNYILEKTYTIIVMTVLITDNLERFPQANRTIFYSCPFKKPLIMAMHICIEGCDTAVTLQLNLFEH